MHTIELLLYHKAPSISDFRRATKKKTATAFLILIETIAKVGKMLCTLTVMKSTRARRITESKQGEQIVEYVEGVSKLRQSDSLIGVTTAQTKINKNQLLKSKTWIGV